MGSDLIQKRIRFSGNVQGVGFRYTARQVAGQYAVSGYVKNCPDGTVELVAEGEATEVSACIGDLRERMGHFIRKVDQESAPAGGAFTGFSIQY